VIQTRQLVTIVLDQVGHRGLVEDGWIDASAPEDRAPRWWALGWPETGSSAPRPPGEVTDGGLRVFGDRKIEVSEL
jgi:hypothetical protein